MTDRNALDCFKCGRALDYAGGDVATATGCEANQPHDGTAFRSYGHYGSTFIDSGMMCPTAEFIEIAICDPCLRAHPARILWENRTDVPPDFDISSAAEGL